MFAKELLCRLAVRCDSGSNFGSYDEIERLFLIADELHCWYDKLTVSIEIADANAETYYQERGTKEAEPSHRPLAVGVDDMHHDERNDQCDDAEQRSHRRDCRW